MSFVLRPLNGEPEKEVVDLNPVVFSASLPGVSVTMPLTTEARRDTAKLILGGMAVAGFLAAVTAVALVTKRMSRR